MTALSIVRLLPPAGRAFSGSIRFRGEELLTASEQRLNQIRGKEIGFVFSDPMMSLNPVMTIEEQLTEAPRLHLGLRADAARARARELLERVGIADAPRRLRQHPHEFSGGMRQRVMIAMAIACDVRLLIADEPTTALDVTVQAAVVELLRDLQRELGMAMILISHDLDLVSAVCDQVVVMYAGRVVEAGAAGGVVGRPRHPYTQGLLACSPHRSSGKGHLPVIPGSPSVMNSPWAACAFHPRCAVAVAECLAGAPALTPVAPGEHVRCVVAADCCGRRDGRSRGGDRFMTTTSDLLEVKDLRVHHPVRAGLLRRQVAAVKAVDGVSFGLRKGEALGLVGESGSGKSTLARAVLRLVPITSGSVVFRGVDLTRLRGVPLRAVRRHVQPVFQDTHGSLNPSFSVYNAIAEPLVNYRVARGAALHARVSELLVQVGLAPSFGSRRPSELSGGQRQRVGIARALAVNPELVVADEPVSALDVSIQAQIINLLHDLQNSLGLTYLFISHDLAVVRHVAQRVAVMYLGRIMEIGETKAVYDQPLHPYTSALLQADRSVSTGPAAGSAAARTGALLPGEVPSALSPPSGCVFRTRCPLADADCATTVPVLEEKAPGRWVACIKVPAAREVNGSAAADTRRAASGSVR